MGGTPRSFGCLEPRGLGSIFKITASQAIELAGRLAPRPKWTLGFFSTTGVICSVLSDAFRHHTEALMLPSGLAGQWVAEYFMVPAPSTMRTTSGRLWYRMRSILVTADGAMALPDNLVERREELRPLRVEEVLALDGARKRLLGHVLVDLLSVVSNVRPGGTCCWDFTLYRTQRRENGMSEEIVGTLQIAGDRG